MKKFLLSAFLCVISFNLMIFGRLLDYINYLGYGILIYIIGLILTIVFFILTISLWIIWEE